MIYANFHWHVKQHQRAISKDSSKALGDAVRELILPGSYPPAAH